MIEGGNEGTPLVVGNADEKALELIEKNPIGKVPKPQISSSSDP